MELSHPFKTRIWMNKVKMKIWSGFPDIFLL
jgi:hypothetical protein